MTFRPPHPARTLRGAVLLAAIVGVAAGCDIVAPPSAAPSATASEFILPPAPERAGVVACVIIQPAECANVAQAVLALLPGALGDPFSIQVRLFGCVVDGEGCPPSLAARNGGILVEYPDGGDVRLFRVAGPPGDPLIEPQNEAVFTDPIQPGSPPVEGGGPFEFEVGHCGLTHVVDFNGAFWVLVGQVNGEHPALYNSERGLIRLQNLDRAQYVGTGNAVFQLARFPGAKRFQLCD
jgi:hypothetical protein